MVMVKGTKGPPMKHMKHMIGCVAMVGAVALLVLVRSGDTPSWLPVVLVLCCPLMMIGMMFAMRGDQAEHAEHDDAARHAQHR